MDRGEHDGRQPFENPGERQLKPTAATWDRWKEMSSEERRRDPEHMRYVQSFRTHESLSEAGKLGFQATARKLGYDGAMELSARFWRQHPERASLPERQTMEVLRDMGQRAGRDYRHIYKTAPRTWTDFAWPGRMKALEVWGGVHERRVRNRLDPTNSIQQARRDDERIIRMQMRGWDVKIVTDRELAQSRRERTTEHLRRFLEPPRDEDTQLMIPGFFPGERGEDAWRYADANRLAEIIEGSGDKFARNYVRDFHVTDSTPPVDFAWMDERSAAKLYRSDQEIYDDRHNRSAMYTAGWRVLVLRAGRDLDIDREALTQQAVVSWLEQQPLKRR